MIEDDIDYWTQMPVREIKEMINYYNLSHLIKRGYLKKEELIQELIKHTDIKKDGIYDKNKNKLTKTKEEMLRHNELFNYTPKIVPSLCKNKELFLVDF